MKPRLRLKGGVWGCVCWLHGQIWAAGYGYTPKEAYDEWEKDL